MKLCRVRLNIPTAPPSQTWSNITKEALNLIITPTGGIPVSGSDKSDVNRMADIIPVISVGHVTLDGRCRCGGLNGELDRTAADGPWGVCGMLVGDPPHICTGTVGGKPTPNWLGVMCLNKCWSWYELSCGSGVRCGSCMGDDEGQQSTSVPPSI